MSTDDGKVVPFRKPTDNDESQDRFFMQCGCQNMAFVIFSDGSAECCVCGNYMSNLSITFTETDLE